MKQDAPDHEVVIVGSGFSGIGAAIKLREMGLHDFVILDRSRIAVAVIELDSAEDDKREEQARRAGLPIIRVKDPRVSSTEMAKRLSGILK